MPAPPKSTIAGTPTGLSELRMSGAFTHPHWVGIMFTALSHRQISVVSGTATVNSIAEWEACFLLDFARSSDSPQSVDFVALAQQSASTMDQRLPKLSSSVITQRERGLEIVLFGPDQIGFLGRCLRHISLLALFPVEIDVKTSPGGTIHDTILVQSITGPDVKPNVVESLQKLLRDFKDAESSSSSSGFFRNSLGVKKSAESA